MKIDRFYFYPDTKVVYKYVRKCIKKTGLSPTFREIGTGCRISAAKAQREVKHLVAWGYLRHIPGRARSITLPDADVQLPMASHLLDDNPSQGYVSQRVGQDNISLGGQINTTTAVDLPEPQTSSEFLIHDHKRQALDRLESPFPREVIDGIELLGRLEDPSAIPGLIRILGHANNDIVNAAHNVLVKMADSAVPYLIDATVTQTDPIPWQSMIALSQIKSEAAFQGLLARATHSDNRVRQYAIYALGSFQDARAISILTVAMHDEDCLIRFDALRTLAGIETDEATALIQDALKDPDPDIRSVAVGSLGQRRHVEALPDLIAALDDSEFYVRLRAIQALGQIKDTVAVEVLMEHSKDSADGIRLAVGELLAQFDSPQVMDTLTEMLKDEMANIRAIAQQSLYQILRRRHES